MKRNSKTYDEVYVSNEPTVQTGNKRLDSFWSGDGGMVLGSAIYLTGTSGSGKTTLAYILQNLLRKYVTSFYSREMSAVALKKQMKRFNFKENKNAFIADRTMCPNVDSYIQEINELLPKVLIIDSFQFIIEEDFSKDKVESAMFEVIQKLRTWTEANNAILIVIGHVNKDGSFEGPNTIKHMFDCHLEMRYNEKNDTRVLYWSKNRKGPLASLYYEFSDNGIQFYTSDEFEFVKQNVTFADFLNKNLQVYLNVLKTSSPSYELFKKDYNREMKKLYKLYEITDIKFTFEAMKLIEHFSKVHNLRK